MTSDVTYVTRQADKLKREFDRMSAAEQLVVIGRYALDVKREILTSAVPQADGTPESARERALLLAAADSTINQIIKVNEVQLRAREVDMLPEILARIDKALAG